MVKVLHIVGQMNMGGTETYLMNIYRHADRTKLQFDFVSYGKNGEKEYYEDEIISLGGKVIKLPAVSDMGPFGIVRALREAIRNGKYDAVHAHTMYNSGFAMLAAKKENVPIRVVHSHTTKDADAGQNMLKKAYNRIMGYYLNKYSTACCGCSLNAAKVLFTQKSIDTKYRFMANAVDFSGFFDENRKKPEEIKKEFNIPDGKYVVGHVGRFGKAKNQPFLADVFNEYLKKNNNSVLLLVGGGDEKVIQRVREKAEKYGIADKIIFAGIQKDIPGLMGAMDAFVFPSVYEGLGIVLLEAQAAGLWCLCSENIQPEADLGMNRIVRMNLSDGPEKWAEMLLTAPGKINDAAYISSKIEESPFRLDSVVRTFYELYGVKE